MVIAVAAVRMVQTAVYDVIDVVAVRNSFMTATFAVNVAAAAVNGVATVGVGGVDVQTVFVVVTVVFVVQMAVVQIVGMVVVAYCGVSAVCTVNVVVVLVGFAFAHCGFLSFVCAVSCGC